MQPTGAIGVSQVNTARSNLQLLRTRLDTILNKAIEFEVSETKEKQKQVMASYKDRLNKSQDFLQEYERAKDSLKAIADAAKDYKTGRGNAALEKLRQYFKVYTGKDFPYITGKAGEYDRMMKAAIEQAFKSVNQANMGRAPKAALTEALQIVANPDIDTNALHNILARGIGALNYEAARATAFIRQNRGIDPRKFDLAERKFGEKEFNRYMKEAYGSLPKFRFVSPEYWKQITAKYGTIAPTIDPSMSDEEARKLIKGREYFYVRKKDGSTVLKRNPYYNNKGAK